MNYFASALDDIMKVGDISGVDLAQRSGIDQSTISRLRSGDRPRVDHEELRSIIAALKDPGLGARLLLAHLEDERAGLGLGITISGPKGADAFLIRETGDIALPAPLHRAFEIIRRHVMADNDLRAIIVHLAKLFERKEKRELAAGRPLPEPQEKDKATRTKGAYFRT